MKNYSAIVCASILSLALGACGGGDAPVEPDTSLQPVDGQTVDDPAAVASGDPGASSVRQTPFGSPALVTSPINGKVRSLPSLTPSASVESRINSTSSGKSDPFAGRVISVRPVPPDPAEVEASFPLAGRGTSPASDLGNALAGGDDGANGATRSASRSSGGSGSDRSGGASVAAGANPAGDDGGGSASSGSGASGSATLPGLAARPPIPDPALARGVEVTGVVLVGTNYQAIVKAPNEPTSRYVSAGQRLSGGRVLVKRIENQGSETVVVLEEDGVEVIRSVGAPPEGSAGGATAMLPELMPAS